MPPIQLAIDDLRYDGLDPDDYHVAALQSFRSDLRGGKSLVPAGQADLELVATDAMMLSLYHLYLGKVDPEKLSSQWNFSSKPVDMERGFEALTRALEARVKDHPGQWFWIHRRWKGGGA